MDITDDEKLMKEERKRYKEMLELEYFIKKEENSSDFFLYFTLFLLVTAPFLLPIISSHLFTKDVYIKAYKDDVLLLEYTGKDNSVKKMNNGYSFTVNDKTYIFKDVDVIEITNLDEGDEE